MSYLLDACQIGQVQKTLKNLRPSREKLASSSSQKVHYSHIQRLAIASQLHKFGVFFPDTHGDLDLFDLITGNLMQ